MTPVLANRFYRARFDPDTGNLLELLPAGESRSLVGRMFVQYRADGRLYSEISDNPLAVPLEVVSVRRSAGAVSSVLRAPQLEIRRSFRLSPNSPLLSVRYEFIPTASAELHGPGILFLSLIDDVNDVSRDERDLYFDGAELGGCRELPCWRVLYRKGYRRGVLVAARSKRMMSRLMYEKQTIEIRPHVYAQQEVNYSLRDIPMGVRPGERHVVEFEIGPWWSGRHKQIMKAAELEKPVRVASEATAAPVDASRSGKVIWLADLVSPSGVTETFHARQWLRLGLPWKPRRKALVCNTGCRPPAFVVRPNVAGPCRVFVGASRSASLGLQFSGDPHPIYRLGVNGTAFHSVLYGPQQASELDFGIVDLTGRTVRVVPNHNGHWPARIDYLRLDPLLPDEAMAWTAKQASPMRMPLAGIPDVGDVFFFLLNRHKLDPRIVEGNIWEQARMGFTRLYWQMHGTYTGFHTNIGTRPPMVCYGHGAFEPQIKGGPLFQRRHDALRLAIDSGRKHGVEVWGAMRMNSYMSGKRDNFFRDRPHMAEITEDGTLCGNKICYAFPEVRAYHRSILIEAAKYGLPGIMLGFLRHSPVLLYHPLLVSGYRARYGKLPPRDMGVADQHHNASLPESGPDYQQWYAYRAGFMTQFGRELKQDLRDAGLGHVKLSLWLRPNHCLFDGINLEDWLNEGLCDEVIADIYSDATLDEPAAEWRRMVKAKVPLLKGIGSGGHVEYAISNLPRHIAVGYDGLCVYASEQFGRTTRDMALLDILRGASIRRQQ